MNKLITIDENKSIIRLSYARNRELKEMNKISY